MKMVSDMFIFHSNIDKQHKKVTIHKIINIPLCFWHTTISLYKDDINTNNIAILLWQNDEVNSIIFCNTIS